jgi:hypothetical protein
LLPSALTARFALCSPYAQAKGLKSPKVVSKRVSAELAALEFASPGAAMLASGSKRRGRS